MLGYKLLALPLHVASAASTVGLPAMHSLTVIGTAAAANCNHVETAHSKFRNVFFMMTVPLSPVGLLVRRNEDSSAAVRRACRSKSAPPLLL